MASLLIAHSFLHRLTSVPLAYVLLWCGLVALSIALVVLLRTRWGQSRPLQKCAVLSLLVHVLFACLTMTVKIVVGDGGGGGMGPPVRVHIVSESSATKEMADIPADGAVDVAPPPLLAPPVADETSQAADATPQSAGSADSPPETPTTTPDQAIAHTEAPLPDSAVQNDAAKIADIHEAGTTPPKEHDTPYFSEPIAPPNDAMRVGGAIAASPAAMPQATALQPTAVATADSTQATDAAYVLRNAPGRLGLVELQGGNAQTEAAVAAALRWLATAQSPDGRWGANRYGAGQEQMVLGHNRGGAGRNADTGISALALLAFLGAGHSHQQGDYQDTVRRGLEFLLRAQAADGNLFGNAAIYAQMYCHAMSTFALAEAQAMSGDDRLEQGVSRAAAFCLRAQHPATGGWRYRAGDTGDTSQLGWQMMALASAQRAGVDVPSHTWVRVDRFLRSVRRGNYGGLASYRPDGPASTSMTAEALYCRLLLDEVSGTGLDEPAVAEATGQLLAALPNDDRINLYYWYYATLALHYRQQSGDQAAAAWHVWNDAITVTLLNAQVADGPDAGSWNTNTVWGGYGGRVYTTATAAMCLEVYYRYAPPPRDRWMATQPRSLDSTR